MEVTKLGGGDEEGSYYLMGVEFLFGMMKMFQK
jgi:hypothetical protein